MCNVVSIAKLGVSYGLYGKLKVCFFLNIRDILLCKALYIKCSKNNKWCVLANEIICKIGKNFLITIDHFFSRNKSSFLTGALIGTSCTTLSREYFKTYFLMALIGLDVFNTFGYALGSVINVFNIKSNYVLYSFNKEKIFLIPLVHKYFLHVNLRDRIIVVDWPFSY
jgi:16S rRNA processing protein RimM